MYIPRKQNDFAAPYSERTSAKTDGDGKDRPPSEIYLKKGKAFLRALKIGKRKDRLRIRRKNVSHKEATKSGREALG